MNGKVKEKKQDKKVISKTIIINHANHSTTIDQSKNIPKIVMFFFENEGNCSLTKYSKIIIIFFVCLNVVEEILQK